MQAHGYYGITGYVARLISPKFQQLLYSRAIAPASKLKGSLYVCTVVTLYVCICTKQTNLPLVSG